MVTANKGGLALEAGTPAARVMDSFMMLPPMSLQPLLRSAAALSGPILTHDAWIFGSAAPNARRATACIRKHSCSVGPLRARPILAQMLLRILLNYRREHGAM